MKAFILWVGRPFVWAYQRTHWFTDKEAWGIYRLFAFAEAVGWTLLIGAIVYRGFDLPYASSVITVAGRIHGMIFISYFVIVLLTARSMEWGIWRISGALLAGMPPYTSVVFEQIMAWHRRKKPALIEAPADID